MDWKPPKMKERTDRYVAQVSGWADEVKLEYFDNIVASAFSKGYETRKMDERKMRKETK